ncbi:peptide chain release factor N(5)-glutamine methyltransferase [Gemmiger sp. An194]|uniref:peptide chain release factor N(5)-glutamine methyltransferase n=1 Tax=Gemmiger sp. An194 TaxID=1965582 RepID=UPI000B550019|nr:peptide chain release factor N(5)-glutamine methyltransferase [Gemmiger sp. An194]OUP25767.1 protein-(glutamine-N5) methyltransferase, release factor-specific [Gemmiger sp. An194]
MVSGAPRAAHVWARARLEAAGVEDAAFDAACLMELVAGKNWRWADGELTEAQKERLEQLTEKRAQRYPLQYLAGRWPFLDFELEVGPGVLIPRADTELLCETGAELLAGKTGPQVLDLCAGSGCVGLGVKRLVPAARVTCLEKSPEAFAYLTWNAAGALPGFDSERPAVQPVAGDVFTYQNELEPESLDLVLSNPPYVTGDEMKTLEPELRFEPEMALEAEHEGLAFYEHIAPGYFAALRRGGWLAVEIGWAQGAAVRGIFEAAGYRNVAVRQDLAGKDRVVLGQKP